jgi:hypothetical protein
VQHCDVEAVKFPARLPLTMSIDKHHGFRSYDPPGHERYHTSCSSLSAMHSLTSETPPLHGSRYTEEDWNNDSTIENGQFYPLSKV